VSTASARLPKLSHANAKQRSREGKASRIHDLLQSQVGDVGDKDVLDIGTGSGFIASFLAERARSLLSVDVVDERVRHDFRFELVESEALPCEDESFDVVISNHVVEHVDDQAKHLREIKRVLRRDGVCYLATPNRFSLIEPHFKLPFLSWLPPGMRDGYVRVAGRGSRYDVRPLTMGRLRALASTAGLRVEDLSTEVAAAVLSRRLALSWVRGVGLLHGLYPSFVVMLRRPDATA